MVCQHDEYGVSSLEGQFHPVVVARDTEHRTILGIEQSGTRTSFAEADFTLPFLLGEIAQPIDVGSASCPVHELDAGNRTVVSPAVLRNIPAEQEAVIPNSVSRTLQDHVRSDVCSL